MNPPPGFTEGRPRYYRPVCIRRSFGFYGGPSAYKETDVPGGAIVLEPGELAGPYAVPREEETDRG